MRSFLFQILIIASISSAVISRAEETKKPEPPKDLATVMSGSCKDADALELYKKYARGSELTKDQDVPGSRVWFFETLKSDLATAVSTQQKNPSWQCLRDLDNAALQEQRLYWEARKGADSCDKIPPPDKTECDHADTNLAYLDRLEADRNTEVKAAGKQAIANLHKGDKKLEAGCSVNCTTDKKFTDVADVAAKSQEALQEQYCCGVFRERDGKDLTDNECHELHKGAQRLGDHPNWRCVGDAAIAALKNIWGAIKGAAIFANDIVEALWHPIATYDSFATIWNEFNKDKLKFGEVIGLALIRSVTGIDSKYSDCLDPSQKAKYVCQNMGTIVSSVGMFYGGWAAIVKLLKTGGLRAVELLGKSTTIANAAKKVETVTNAILKPIGRTLKTPAGLVATAAAVTDVKKSEDAINAAIDATTQPIAPVKAGVTRELRSARAKLGKLTEERKKLVKEGQASGANPDDAHSADFHEVQNQIEDLDKKIAVQKDAINKMKIQNAASTTDATAQTVAGSTEPVAAEATTQALAPVKAGVTRELRSARAKLGKLTEERKKLVKEGQASGANPDDAHSADFHEVQNQIEDLDKKIAAQKDAINKMKAPNTATETPQAPVAPDPVAAKPPQPTTPNSASGTTDNTVDRAKQIANDADAARKNRTRTDRAIGVVKKVPSAIGTVVTLPFTIPFKYAPKAVAYVSLKSVDGTMWALQKARMLPKEFSSKYNSFRTAMKTSDGAIKAAKKTIEDVKAIDAELLKKMKAAEKIADKDAKAKAIKDIEERRIANDKDGVDAEHALAQAQREQVGFIKSFKEWLGPYRRTKGFAGGTADALVILSDYQTHLQNDAENDKNLGKANQAQQVPSDVVDDKRAVPPPPVPAPGPAPQTDPTNLPAQ